MKIAFVLSKCHIFGSSRNVIEVSKYLSKRGHDVHVFANSCDSVPWITFHKIPAFSSNYLVREGMTGLLETIALRKNDFDVTVAQPSRYFSPDVCHVRFAIKAAHERVGYKNNMTYKFYSLTEEYNIKRCKKIIAMSNSVKNDIIDYYKIPEEKIEVVYDGVDLDEFNPKNRKTYSENIKKAHNIQNDDTVLLFAGNPFVRKGLEYAIRALPLINENVKLLVLGNDSINLYLEIAKRLGVEKQIVYAGFTNEVKKYFSVGDIFVFPTLYEPFGLVITEAMASGVPAVVSRCAGAAELIEGGKEGMLLDNPKNPKEIAEKINYLIDNNLYRKMGKAARAKAEQYTWKRTAEDMLAVFEDVIKLKKRKNSGC